MKKLTEWAGNNKIKIVIGLSIIAGIFVFISALESA